MLNFQVISKGKKVANFIPEEIFVEYEKSSSQQCKMMVAKVIHLGWTFQRLKTRKIKSPNT